MATLTTTGLHVPATLNRFAELVGSDELQRLLTKVRKKLSERDFISSATRSRYAIPSGLLDLYGKRVSQPRNVHLESSPHLYDAITFAHSAVEFSRHLSAPGRVKLKGAIRNALAPDRDARHLAHEFRAAVAYASRGWDIQFTDLEGAAQFDFIARKGSHEVELECKTIAPDLGSAMSIEQLDIFAQELDLAIRQRGVGALSQRMDIILGDRLPNERRTLVEAVTTLLHGEEAELKLNGATIRKQPIPPLLGASDAGDLKARVQLVLANIQEEKNGAVFAIYSKTQVVAINVYSEREPRRGDKTLRMLREASDQLSRTRPAVIWSHLLDLSSEDLKQLVNLFRNGTPTLIEGTGARLLQSKKHEHVAGLLFSGEAAVRKYGGSNSLIIHSPFFMAQGSLYDLWSTQCRFNPDKEKFY